MRGNVLEGEEMGGDGWKREVKRRRGDKRRVKRMEMEVRRGEERRERSR